MLETLLFRQACGNILECDCQIDIVYNQGVSLRCVQQTEIESREQIQENSTSQGTFYKRYNDKKRACVIPLFGLYLLQTNCILIGCQLSVLLRQSEAKVLQVVAWKPDVVQNNHYQDRQRIEDVETGCHRG